MCSAHTVFEIRFRGKQVQPKLRFKCLFHFFVLSSPLWHQ